MAVRAWVAAALSAAVVVTAAFVAASAGLRRWHAWEATLPPPMAAAQGRAAALSALTPPRSSTAAEEIPPWTLGYPRWRMQLQRLFMFHNEHVRVWVVPTRLVTSDPAAPGPPGPPAISDVWIVAAEGYCRQMGPASLGGPVPAPPPGALCWEDRAFDGDTGAPLWGYGGPA